jgi:enterochelin esterase-like enzyme
MGAVARPPAVIEDKLVFAFEDRSAGWSRVALDCDDAIAGGRRFRRTAYGWGLALPRPQVRRLEYRLLLTDRGGESQLVCDPANPERVRTAFGERSVALMPGYENPCWTRASILPGEYQELTVTDPVVGDVPVRLWSPAELRPRDAAPVLLVHDGPEFDDLAQVTKYAASMAVRRWLPSFRVALIQPVQRDEWYAANPDYIAAEQRVIDAVLEAAPIEGSVVSMGASMGGLCALLLGLADARVGGVFAQSSSFFTPRLDPQESGYPYFDRVAAAVAEILTPPSAPAERHLHVSLTCGALEENHTNNHEMARALEARGHRVAIEDVPDLHNYTAWRDCFDPTLTTLLQTVWGRRG